MIQAMRYPASTLIGATATATATATILILAWDLSGLDLALAWLWGAHSGFPLRQDWFLNTVMHTGAKDAAWLLGLFLGLMVLRPRGLFARLSTSQRVQLAITPMVAVALVSVIKSFSQTSCPWELHEFGGTAVQLSHWRGWLTPDGGGGQCFPAGHASSGFAFVGGFFPLRAMSERFALLWLCAALAAGLLLGMAQQLRGAHFLSHTLWSGWLCWMAGWAIDKIFVWRSQSQRCSP